MKQSGEYFCVGDDGRVIGRGSSPTHAYEEMCAESGKDEPWRQCLFFRAVQVTVREAHRFELVEESNVSNKRKI